MSRLGSVGANEEEAASIRLKEELDVLYAFAAFIVLAPRTPAGNRARNSVNYAEKVLSSLRGHYARIHGRLTGNHDRELGGKQLSYTLSGLRKLAPSEKKYKRHLLQP